MSSTPRNLHWPPCLYIKVWNLMADSQREQRFRAFVSGRYPALVRTGYLLTGDRGHDEDLVQSAAASARGSASDALWSCRLDSRTTPPLTAVRSRSSCAAASPPASPRRRARRYLRATTNSSPTSKTASPTCAARRSRSTSPARHAPSRSRSTSPQRGSEMARQSECTTRLWQHTGLVFTREDGDPPGARQPHLRPARPRRHPRSTSVVPSAGVRRDAST
jgi:hypothetical protein